MVLLNILKKNLANSVLGNSKNHYSEDNYTAWNLGRLNIKINVADDQQIHHQFANENMWPVSWTMSKF